ncbi:MAG TPA: transposase, partial [Gaiellaceae bacterium]
MGRPHRYLAAGAYYHVGIRGNNHAPIVLDDGDRIVFFHILRRVERRYGWRTHVRCLMGNHYHLLVETPQPNLADGMRDLNGGYARAFNERHKRKDHVFGRRYWSKVIESDEQYEATVEYIVNNPLHHGFVRRLEQWRWTSGPAVGAVDSPRVSRHRQADPSAVARRLSDGGATAFDRARREVERRGLLRDVGRGLRPALLLRPRRAPCAGC